MWGVSKTVEAVEDEKEGIVEQKKDKRMKKTAWKVKKERRKDVARGEK